VICRNRGVILTVLVGLRWFVPAWAQDEDTAALRELAENLHGAYAQKDLDRLLSLWSEQSPQRATQRQAAQKLFSSGPGVAIHETTAGTPEIAADRARVRIEREVTAPDPKISDKKRLVLECVKEPGGWRIWKLITAAEDLATRLANTAADSDRALLLAQEQELAGPDLALALIDRGREARNHGDMKQALRTLELAQTIAERAGAQQTHALALNNTGLVYYDQADYAEALHWYQRSLALSESLHDDAGTARSLNNMGAVYLDCGEFTSAWENFEKSQALGEKIHSARLISNAVGNMAIIHGQRGDYVQALALFKKSYQLHEPSGDKRALAIDLIDLGNVFLWQGDFAQAEDYFRQSLALSEAAGLKPLMAYALGDLGRVAELRGDLPGAIQTYQRSLALCTEVEDKGCASSSLSYIGSAFSESGDQDKAIEYYRKTMELHKTMGGGKEAELTLTKLAAAYNRKGEFQEAARIAGEARDAAENLGIREALWRAHLEAGKAYQGMHEPVRAEAELSRSIATIEQMRQDVAGAESEQENFFEGKLEPYHRKLELLVSANRNAEAFAFAERAKARVLVDALKNGRTQMDVLMTAEEREHDHELRMKVASLNGRLLHQRQAPVRDSAAVSNLSAELERTRLAYSAYETALYAQHPQWRLQSGSIEPVALEQALQLLPRTDAAFVEFVVTDDKVYTFVSGGSKARGPAKVRVFTAPVSRKELTDRVQNFRQQLSGRDLGFRTTAAALYKLLLAPAGAELQGKRHVVIVPDGVLWELPFQALVTPAGKYLLEESAISYAPSFTAMKAMVEAKRQRRPASRQVQLLAMGNPAWEGAAGQSVKALYRGQDLGSLPMAETEVRELGRIYGESQSHIYVGKEARESRFKAEAGEPNVLHLATHGILNNASPLYSYLLLAGEGDGSAEDGLLEAKELMRMNLRAELVVLSACETARGRVGAGEGVIGLSWALFVSGVPTTVLSQWKVESESTSRLMVAFHRNRKQGMSDAEALQAAALLIRKDPAYQHPFYWTPFIVIGAGI
jgi:CHAT domain-containing protein/tetratricopeptide (TPR) repeat protein